jgi:SAM-dependent methyltransferase
MLNLQPESLESVDDPLTRFYETDYPWPEDEGFEEAYRDPCYPYTLNNDISFIKEVFSMLNAGEESRVLDLFCGSGRLSIPLARIGFDVTGVDLSTRQIARLRDRLQAEPVVVRNRVNARCCDAANFKSETTFDFALMGFNSLCVLDSVVLQTQTIESVAKVLKPGGTLIIDLPNPLQSHPFGSGGVHSVLCRRKLRKLNSSYIKYATSTPMDSQQLQTISGWYDLVENGGHLRRIPFEFGIRFLFPEELKAIGKQFGLETKITFSDHSGAAFDFSGKKLIAVLQKA